MGIALLALLSFFWGLAYPAMKIVLGEPVTATELAALFLVVLSLGLTSMCGRQTGRKL
jgi:hypothetical protein